MAATEAVDKCDKRKAAPALALATKILNLVQQQLRKGANETTKACVNETTKACVAAERVPFPWPEQARLI